MGRGDLGSKTIVEAKPARGTVVVAYRAILFSYCNVGRQEGCSLLLILEYLF